ncbi:AAA family ATPase [Alienimonas sp. DA493]|uniref:AAA family ATPase n=1 Tax=Alienimonas sp. DA493 TaxID=3373605 RepID=UPI003753EEC7
MQAPLLDLAAELAGAPATLKETHISRVALAGPPGSGVVLKQCKPVDFGFVDLRTREQRRAALEKEHAVNDRFAPGVYRGVRELPDGEPVLEMLRLNEADTLEAKVKRGEATTADLDAILDHLLPLFEQSARGPEVAKWGAPAVIRRNLIENLEALDAAALPAGGRMAVKALRAAQLTYLTLHDAAIRRRAADGFVRDGHGDLRAEHIYLTAEGVKALDGIAFGDRLRCVDVADEFAFLAHSLDQIDPAVPCRPRPVTGKRLLRRYRTQSGDPASDKLLSFYRSYRAAVRAKVAALSDADAEDGNSPLNRNLFGALEHAQAFELPEILIAFGGRSGTGKSTVAAAVADRLGASRLRSDELRKQALGVAADAPAPDGGYDPAVSDAVYAELVSAAADAMTSYGTAVVDATFLTASRRTPLVERCAHLAGEGDEPEDWPQSDQAVLFIWGECDDAVAEGRIAQRAAAGEDVSDATVEVRRQQAAVAEPPTDDEFAGLPAAALLRLDTDAPVEALTDRVIDALRDLVRVAGSAGVQ